jgi:molybdopterin converting factor small subunit
MEIRVLFFARSRELAGTREAAVAVPEGATTSQLLDCLLQKVGSELCKGGGW